MKKIFDDVDGRAVHELEGGRQDAAAHDPRDRLAGLRELIEDRHRGYSRAGQRRELENHLGDDTERALRADEQLHQRVARRVLGELAAEAQDFTAGQYDSEADDVVARHAVFETARAAGVGGDIAAD